MGYYAISDDETGIIVGARYGRRASDLVGHAAKTGYTRVQSVELGKLAGYYGLSYGNKVVTDNIEMASSEFCRGFLQGLV